MSAGPRPAARVIVVDDDRLIREMVRDAIGELASIECCDSSEAALEALHREPADLIVSDLTMPGLSGIELLEEIRRAHPSVDFLLLTGNATVESATISPSRSTPTSSRSWWSASSRSGVCSRRTRSCGRTS